MSNEFDYIPFSETGTPEPPEGFGFYAFHSVNGQPMAAFIRGGCDQYTCKAEDIESIPIPSSIADRVVGCVIPSTHLKALPPELEEREGEAFGESWARWGKWHWQLKKEVEA